MPVGLACFVRESESGSAEWKGVKAIATELLAAWSGDGQLAIRHLVNLDHDTRGDYEMHGGEGTAASRDPAVAREENYPNPVYGWYVVVVLLVCFVVSFMDRMVLNLLIEPIKRDLQLSDTEISLLLGIAFALFNATLGLPVGWLADRANRVRIVAAGVFFWSVMTALCGTARSFATLFTYRMGVGIGEATTQPAGYSMISDLFPPTKRGLALSVFNLGVAIGSGLALFVGAQVIHEVSKLEGQIELPLVGELFPWQLVFIVLGLPGLLVALWAWTLREPRRLGALRMTRAADGTLKESPVRVKEFLDYVRAIGVPFSCAVICYALIAMGGYGNSAWLPSFFQRTHGLSVVEVGRWMGVLSVSFGVVGIVLSGYVSDWLIKRGHVRGRVILLALSGIGAAPFMLGMATVPNPYLALWLLGPAYVATALTSAVWAAVITEIVPNQMRGLAVALAILAANLVGMGLGATIVAVVTDRVFNGGSDPLALGRSLAVVTPLTYLLSSSFGLVAVLNYQRALDHLRRWSHENTEVQATS
jgi:MFS family permease